VGEWIVAQIVMPVFTRRFTTVMTCNFIATVNSLTMQDKSHHVKSKQLQGTLTGLEPQLYQLLMHDP